MIATTDFGILVLMGTGNSFLVQVGISFGFTPLILPTAVPALMSLRIDSCTSTNWTFSKTFGDFNIRFH
jgi:hypothetical protein